MPFALLQKNSFLWSPVEIAISRSHFLPSEMIFRQIAENRTIARNSPPPPTLVKAVLSFYSPLKALYVYVPEKTIRENFEVNCERVFGTRYVC